MGNLQGSEGKSSKAGKSPGKNKVLMKIKRRGKADEPQFTGIVPQDEEAQAQTPTPVKEAPPKVTHPLPPPPSYPCLPSETKPAENLMVVTDSWRKVNKLSESSDATVTGQVKQEITPPSVESSSDSNFTDPAGFATEINQCYYSEESVNADGVHLDVQIPETKENWIEDIITNSFKLNEYKVRRENEIQKKLSKLGVSKTSQISLDANMDDCFASDNVELVEQFMDNDLWVEGKSHIYGSVDSNNKTFTNENNNTYTRVETGANGDKIVGECRRHFSVPDAQSEEHIVLKKVASLTLDKATIEAKIVKPKFVPEKLDFQLYEKFEDTPGLERCLPTNATDLIITVKDYNLFMEIPKFRISKLYQEF